MLASTLGIRLILWLGRTVPTPAPLAVSDALTRVEVTNDAEQGDGFQMTFSLGKAPTGDFGLLSAGTLAPTTRVILGVVMGVAPEVLIDGIITHHQVTPSNEPGQSTLTVTGRDVGVMLDLHERNESYPNQPDSVIVLRLLATYAQYGLVPQVMPTTDVPIIIDRIPRQQETDLRFIRRLAERNGYVFYVEPLTFGVNTAFWGPESRLGFPQPALTTQMGSFTNVKSLNFSNDALAPVSTEGAIQEPITRMSIPIPSLPSLRIPPLAASSAQAQRSVILRESANQNAAQAATAAVAAVTRAPEAVTGEGELDAAQYGGVLRARKLVGVRGAGISYDGNYYVRRVTHVITRGEYTQRFTVSREGTGSLLPVVRP
jgi:hypothetical protein